MYAIRSYYALPNIDIRTSAQAVLAYWEGVVLLAKTRNDPRLILKLGKNTVPVITSYSIHYTKLYEDRLWDIAKRHNLVIIEDASHAHGAAWKGLPAGSYNFV